MANHRSIERYWSQPITDVLASLHSSPTGLSSTDARQRLKQVGPNLIEQQRQTTALTLWLKQARNPLLLILIFAALVSVIAHEWIDVVVILAIVLGSAILTFVQEYRSATAIERLRARVTIKATVLRDQQAQSLPATEIVPGDVILLSAGSLIPADGVLLEAKDCFINQAVLTGESLPIEKQVGLVGPLASLPERTNCVFSGTSVRSGTARALIVQTGTNTLFGQIAKRLTSQPSETEFERSTRQFGNLLTQMMIGLLLLVFAANILLDKPAIESLLFAIALAVGLSPELLPAILSITLARGAQEMAAHGVIVRRLNAIENLGSMDVLCTDKTGTLTEGSMRLDLANDVQGVPSEKVLCQAYLNASFQSGLNNPLDEAIIAQAQEAGLDISAYRKVDEIPYDFVRKRLSVVVRDAAGELTLISKGALEHILSICSKVQLGTALYPLDADWQHKLEQLYYSVE